MLLSRTLAGLGAASIAGGALALVLTVDARATTLGPGHLALALAPIGGIALVFAAGLLRPGDGEGPPS